jgi:hypothetical protein
VMDNYSTENETIAVLTAWQNKGLKVDFNQGPYSIKGELTLKAFDKHFPQVDIALPLDIDEYVIPFRNSTPVANKTMLLEELTAFKRSGAACWAMREILMSFVVVSNMSMGNITSYFTTVRSVDIAKKMVSRSKLLELDHGNHHPTLRSGNCESAENRLGMLHYHFRDPLLVVQHAIQDTIQFGHLPVGTTVDNVGTYRQRLEHLLAIKASGYHKLGEILGYMNNGSYALSQFVFRQFPLSKPVAEWLTIEQVIGSVALIP